MPKTPDYYRSLPYTRKVRIESDDRGVYFIAYIEELPGVEADGPTEVAARAELASAFDDYLAAMLEWDEVIPEPPLWPESFGWDPNAPGAVAGTVSRAALAVNVMESATAVPLSDAAVDALRIGERAKLETVAA